MTASPSQRHSFARGERIPLYVNALTSTHTQIPLDYYSLGAFCLPEDGILNQEQKSSVGQVLTGNRIQNSPYKTHMLENVECQSLCQVKLDAVTFKKLEWHFKHVYQHNWIVDDLPSAFITSSNNPVALDRSFHGVGFPIGYLQLGMTPFIYNHVNIHLDYVAIPTTAASTNDHQEQYRVVHFAVDPLSIRWVDAEYCNSRTSSGAVPTIWNTKGPNQQVYNGATIIYTYSVVWHLGVGEWSRRWDVYAYDKKFILPRLQTTSIFNSLLVVCVMGMMVLGIIHKNLRAANRRLEVAAAATTTMTKATRDELEKSTRWVFLHADVFRPPSSYPILYCVCLGSGVQLGCAVFGTLILAAWGWLSPAGLRRSTLVTTFLALYLVSSIVAGYTASRIYQAFRGRHRHVCTVATAVLFPGMFASAIGFVNMNLYWMDAVANIRTPTWTILCVAATWCSVSVPLVFAGAYIGYRQRPLAFPTNTSAIPRPIPPPASFGPMASGTLLGCVSFSTIFMELYYRLSFFWMNRCYYVFGITLVVFVLTVTTCVFGTVLLVCFQLRQEDYQWWWLAFYSSGSIGLYTFAYAIYWFHWLHSSGMLMTYLLYFGTMFWISVAMTLLFGSVGALVTLGFLCRLYSSIQVDGS